MLEKKSEVPVFCSNIGREQRTEMILWCVAVMLLLGLTMTISELVLFMARFGLL